MKNLKLLYFIITVFITNFNFAQLSDLAKIDYTYISSNVSDIGYSRFRGLMKRR